MQIDKCQNDEKDGWVKNRGNEMDSLVLQIIEFKMLNLNIDLYYKLISLWVSNKPPKIDCYSISWLCIIYITICLEKIKTSYCTNEKYVSWYIIMM